jgi:carboxyl-terminal processing protease
MKKAWIAIIGALMVVFLVSAACMGGFLAGRVLPTQTPLTTIATLPQLLETESPTNPPTEVIQSEVTDAPMIDRGTPADLEVLFKPFWESWDVLHERYVDQPLDDEALMRGAIRGMLEALGDQHTSYMDPDQFRQANIPLDGEYEGIGAWVDTNATYLTIVSPMPGSPAEKAGLKPGDQIIAIDGDDMTGIDGNLVIRRVLGPAGTLVRLTILREGIIEPFDVDITRARITIPSVDSRMLDDNIAYVQLLTFGETTTNDLRNTLRELLRQNPDGLILDLRNNGGGYLNTAIDVASEFILDGVVMYEQFGDGSRQTFQANGRGLATDIPLVVLVNGGTASASEIVAGAIQDRGRGIVVGTTTFGKGSVQTWAELSDGQGALRVTIARWFTPSDRLIHETGIEPDIIVELPEEVSELETDVQLERAIEVLKTGQ